MATPGAMTEAAAEATGMGARRRRARLGAAVAAAVLLALAAAQPAPAQDDGVLPAEEVASRIAAAYGVEVLEVRRRDLVGGPAYAVKVMTPPGDSNAALMVRTLMVDAATGELIPQFRHRTFGYQDRGRPKLEPDNPTAGETLRLRTFRGGPESYQ